MIKQNPEKNDGTEPNIIKVMIVEDHPLMRKGIKEMIESEADMQVCAEADTANNAIRLLAENEPAIVIVDISLAGEASGIDLIKSLARRKINTRAIVLSMYAEVLYVERAMQAGAHAYIAKSEAPQTLIAAIREVIKGKRYVSESISKKIINKIANETPATAGSVEKLTDRELEVFELIGQGYKTNDIAKRLNLSVNTVETHRKNIRAKLGFTSSGELIRNAIEWMRAKG